MVEAKSGVERFIFDLRKIYDPYPFQRAFHGSSALYGFLGGAAGPGKTAAGLAEQFIACQEFNADDGPKVHTLTLRRTNPKLEATVITRFRELFPKEVYRQFNQTKSEVTWLNGATTQFGSMQYDHNAWDWQGQWFHIYYDELCEFTFTQWNATSAWNRCPVSKQIRKYGSGNPIGIGALWVEDLFVKHTPCDGMDEDQRRRYEAEDYAYFPATYLDNPVYANDKNFLKSLDSYPAAMRDALKFGKWGVAAGYFRGLWDEAEHIFPYDSVQRMPWWRHWLSGNWGYEHPATFYKHCMDDYGVVRTYDEMFVKHQNPEQLAESLVKFGMRDEYDEKGHPAMPEFVDFTFSFDAQYSKETATMGGNPNSVAGRMTPTLSKFGIPAPIASTRDKLGRDTLMREKMEKRIQIGESAEGHPILVPAWQISDRCIELKRVIPIAKSDDKDPEKIEPTSDGTDSPLQGAGYGLYSIFGRPNRKPLEVRAREFKSGLIHQEDPHRMAMAMMQFEQREKAPKRRPSSWRRS